MSGEFDLIEAEIPRLRRYARYLVRDVERADDLVQDCLTRAVDKIHLWEPGSNMKAWLFAILHNLHVNNLRKAQRAPFAREISPENPGPPTPGNQIDSLRIRELEVALSQLSAEHREVIVMVAVEGMAYQDAADILNVPVGTVRSRLSRARDFLREMLGEVPRGEATPEERQPAEPLLG